MKKGRTFASNLIGLVLLVVFCWSGVYLFQYAEDEYQMYKLEKQLDEGKPAVISKMGVASGAGEVDFSDLLELNGETVGWITINGTAIDYPIVQAKDNDYYLNHDFNNNPSIQGSIFMDYRNQTNLADNHTILYGHNMKNGTMFHDLNKYNKESFLKEHKYIDYYRETGYSKWQIFSTYNTDPNFDYLQTEFGSADGYVSFINKLCAKSDFTYKGKAFSDGDKILTLSTCSSGLENGRRVVHARLVEEGTYGK